MTDKQIDQIIKECAEAINENRDLRRECMRLRAKNAGLRHRIEATEKATAKNIADWIAFRAFHGGYVEPVQNVLSEMETRSLRSRLFNFS